MLKHRLLLGAVLIAALVGLFWLDAASVPTRLNGVVILALVAALAVAGGWELAPLLSRPGKRVGRPLVITSAFLSLASFYWLFTNPGVNGMGGWFVGAPYDLAAWGPGLSLVLGLALGMRTRDAEAALHTGMAACFASVYLGVFLWCALEIRINQGPWVLLGVIATIKACDIGAYFVGVNLGKNKLIPWLSPGKTWEGLTGGVASAAVVGAGLGALWEPLGPVGGAVMGAALGGGGQAGDLFESLLKRAAGVKDSGRVPGFGGVLDLIDSPLVAIPAAMWLLRWMT